jgi:DNA-binding response OmpR family regulator
MVESLQSLNTAIGRPLAGMDSATPIVPQRFRNPLPEMPPQTTQSQPAAKIIIADDDPWVTRLLSATLLRFGVECVVASNGRQALELTKSILPDVLVLDVRMPELDGFEVLFSLKRDEGTKHVKVIMLTADDQKTDMIRGYGYGADEYVTKPFDAIELAGRILRRLPAPSPTLTAAGYR